MIFYDELVNENEVSPKSALLCSGAAVIVRFHLSRRQRHTKGVIYREKRWKSFAQAWIHPSDVGELIMQILEYVLI